MRTCNWERATPAIILIPMQSIPPISGSGMEARTAATCSVFLYYFVFVFLYLNFGQKTRVTCQKDRNNQCHNYCFVERDKRKIKQSETWYRLNFLESSYIYIYHLPWWRGRRELAGGPRSASSTYSPPSKPLHSSFRSSASSADMSEGEKEWTNLKS